MSAAAAYCETGTRAMMAGDPLTAQGAFLSAIERDPQCSDALANLALVYLTTQRLDAAVMVGKRSVKIDPGSAEKWANLGYILGAAGDYAGCEKALRRSIKLRDNATAWKSLGLCLYSLGRFSESIAAFDEALRHLPGDMEIIDKRALSMLGAGRFVEGLIDNKVRWEVLACHPLMHSAIPEWKGESLEGKSIVVLHEQGFGDTLQFVRFVPWLRKLGAKRIVLSVPSALVELLRIAKVADEVINIRDLPEGGIETVDFKSPTMTVPAHVGLTLDKVSDEPYLFPPLRAKTLTGDKLKVGLVWAGKPMYEQDRWRSMHVMDLAPLLEIEGVDFYSMQVDVPPNQELWRVGLSSFVTDLAPRIKDWSDTAALMDELDLLVSVDTAPAHLAGAMGKPVALMTAEASCWRWGDHKNVTTHWYRDVKLFRQKRQGNWKPVIAEVGKYIRSRRDG